MKITGKKKKSSKKSVSLNNKERGLQIFLREHVSVTEWQNSRHFPQPISYAKEQAIREGGQEGNKSNLKLEKCDLKFLFLRSDRPNTTRRKGEKKKTMRKRWAHTLSTYTRIKFDLKFNFCRSLQTPLPHPLRRRRERRGLSRRRPRPRARAPTTSPTSGARRRRTRRASGRPKRPAAAQRERRRRRRQRRMISLFLLAKRYENLRQRILKR